MAVIPFGPRNRDGRRRGAVVIIRRRAVGRAAGVVRIAGVGVVILDDAVVDVRQALRAAADDAHRSVARAQQRGLRHAAHAGTGDGRYGDRIEEQFLCLDDDGNLTRLEEHPVARSHHDLVALLAGAEGLTAAQHDRDLAAAELDRGAGLHGVERADECVLRRTVSGAAIAAERPLTGAAGAIGVVLAGRTRVRPPDADAGGTIIAVLARVDRTVAADRAGAGRRRRAGGAAWATTEGRVHREDQLVDLDHAVLVDVTRSAIGIARTERKTHAGHQLADAGGVAAVAVARTCPLRVHRPGQPAEQDKACRSKPHLPHETLPSVPRC